MKLEKIEQIEVIGLFGRFNHKVKINNKCNITIITAPNGYGKTIILNILYNILKGRFNYFLKLKFDKIALTLSGGVLEIVKRFDNNIPFSVAWTVSGQDKNEWDFRKEDYKEGELRKLFPPWIEQIDKDKFFDLKLQEILELKDVIHYLPHRIKDQFNEAPSWLKQVLRMLVEVHLVMDQRLIQRNSVLDRRSDTRGAIDTIKKHAIDLRNKIAKKTEISASIAQKLDSNFPRRLLGGFSDGEIYAVDNLKEKLEKLYYWRERLEKYGLIVSTKESHGIIPSGFDIKQEDVKVLSLYVKDNEEKLSVYDELLRKIELFTSILNNKRLLFKKVLIDKESGFYFRTDTGDLLELTDLSSGEQHEVILLYELIFKAKDNDLVLIDEPEISLHIVWQKEFLNDLKNIIALQNIVVVMATHSPQIINGNWDLTVDLAEEEEE